MSLSFLRRTSAVLGSILLSATTLAQQGPAITFPTVTFSGDEPWTGKSDVADAVPAQVEDDPDLGCANSLAANFGGTYGGSGGGSGTGSSSWSGAPTSWVREVPTLASASSGEFVAYHNGQVGIDRVDLSIPGRGVDLVFSRAYNSKWASKPGGGPLGPMGYGWTHNFEIKLVNAPASRPAIPGSTLSICHGAKRNDTFVDQGGGVWKGPRGVFSLLFSVETAGVITGWDLRMPDGSELHFSAAGLLTTVKDASDNTISLTYSGTDLIRITDTYNRDITFTYTNSRITTVTDFNGRTVAYTYNANNELTEVRTPTVNSTNGWDDFPNGRAEKYEYWTGGNHLLRRIFTPNDVRLSLLHTTEFVYSPWLGTNPSGRFWCTQRIVDGYIESYAYEGTSPTFMFARTTFKDRLNRLAQYQYSLLAIALSAARNVSPTNSATTQRTADNDNRVTLITEPEQNTKQRVYDTSNALRWAQGNVLSITWTPKPGSSLSNRTVSYVWEPVFQHPCAFTDERTNTTTFLCDYFEGDTATTQPLIEAELRMAPGSLPTGITALLQNVDFNGDGVVKNVVQGKRVKTIYPTVTLPNFGATPGQQGREGDAQQAAISTSTWNQYGQLTSTTDEEQNTTVYLYYPTLDPDGDGVPNGTGNPVTGGYLRQEIEDVILPYAGLPGVVARSAPGVDIGRNSNLNPPAIEKKTDWTYNPVGMVTSVVDPRGIRTAFSVNELDETWMAVYADNCDSSRRGGFDPNTAEVFPTQWTFQYAEMFKYDHNGNMLQRVYKNADVLPGDEDGGEFKHCWETNYQYDRQDRVIFTSQELSSQGDPEDYVYDRDAIGNVVAVHDSENHTTEYSYDERHKLSSVTVGSGYPEALTTTHTYSLNGRLISRTRGTGATAGREVFEYDGFDRLSRHLNSVGSETLATYDDASNVTVIERRGTTGGASPSNIDPLVNAGSNSTLSRAEFGYDARNRRYRHDLIDPIAALTDGVLTPGDGRVSARLDFDRLGRLTFTVEDDDKATEVQYDGVGRAIRTIDAANNEVVVAYDDNDNVIKTTEVEQYPANFNPTSRSYETFDIYDSLNRRVSTTDNIGQTHYFAYDSRGNMTKAWDAKGSVPGNVFINGRSVNLPGNESRFWHNGANRRWKEEHGVASNSANTDGMVRILQEWDKIGQLISKSDDNGNKSTWTYDALGRVTVEGFADGSAKTYSYESGGWLSLVSDARGNHLNVGHDRAGRLTSITTSVNATGPYQVANPVNQFYEYNGLDLQTRSFKDDYTAITTDDWDVVRTFDGLGRLRTESQNGRVVTHEWKEEGKRTKLKYPTSATYPAGLDIDYTYDSLDRISQISAGSTTPTAQYLYAGPDRLLRRLTFISYPFVLLNERHYDGATSNASDANYYDGARRPIRMETTDRTSNLQSGFAHGFDREGMRTHEARLHHSGGRGDRMTNEPFSRLVRFERDLDSLSVLLPTGGTPAVTTDWTLDGVHNWSVLTTNGTPQANSTNNLNQYTSFAGRAQDYDADGNLVGTWNGSNPVTLRYDALNRLREVVGIGGALVTHDYDANGRRINTAAAGLSGQPTYVEYYYDGWTVVEETNGGSSSVLRRFIGGSSVDEPLCMANNTSTWGATGEYYYQRNELGSICALTDLTGSVVERYTYDAYGAAQFESVGNVALPILQSQCGNPLLLCGVRLDGGPLPQVHMRNRQYVPALGRFVQRDPIGIWENLSSCGSPYAYVGSLPLDVIDPLGLSDMWKLAAGVVKTGLGVRSTVSGVAKLPAAAVASGIAPPVGAVGFVAAGWNIFSGVKNIQRGVVHGTMAYFLPEPEYSPGIRGWEERLKKLTYAIPVLGHEECDDPDEPWFWERWWDKGKSGLGKAKRFIEDIGTLIP